MVVTRTNREVKSRLFMNDICQGRLSLFADGCRPRVFLCCFSPCLCYTRDVADLSELIVARDAQSRLVVHETRLSAVFKAHPSLFSGSFLLSLMYRHI